MKHLTHFLVSLFHRKWLKYGLVTLVAAVPLVFVGENSLWNLRSNKQRITKLKKEIWQYTERYEKAQQQLKQLDSDPHAIRRIARERYFMKADDEDIFVLSDDPQETNPIDKKDETIK